MQCGICIPGMVLAAKALLDREPPTGPTTSARASPATSAGAPATRRSSRRWRRGRGAPRRRRRAAPRAERRGSDLLSGRARSRRRSRSWPSGRARCGRSRAAPTSWSRPRTARSRRGALFDLTAVPELQGHRGARRPPLDRRRHHPHRDDARRRWWRRYAPALPAACAVVGGPQIRNRGTLGGNLANASPAADTVPPLYAADAVVELVSVSSRREVPIARVLHRAARETVLAARRADPRRAHPQRPGVRGAFLRLGQRQAQAISKVSVAVAMTFRDGRPDWVRVALGSVAPTVVRAPRDGSGPARGRATTALRRGAGGGDGGGRAHRRPALDPRVPARDGRRAARARGAPDRRRLDESPAIALRLSSRRSPPRRRRAT